MNKTDKDPITTEDWLTAIWGGAMCIIVMLIILVALIAPVVLDAVR